MHQFAGKANQKRFEKLAKLIYCIIKKGESSLQKIGEGLEEDIDVESKVKKVKRFLKSKYTDYQSFFLPFITSLLAGFATVPRLLIVIDGSVVGNGCMASLVSVVYGKRSIPLAWLVCKQKKGHMKVHLHQVVLEQVASLLPAGPEIVLLGDGEFDSVALQEFAYSQGWKYVLRTAKNSLITTQNGDQFHLGDCHPDDSQDHFWLPEVYFSKQRYGVVNCVVWHQQVYENPIYLVSNVEEANEVMSLYKNRFSIETIFGDIKSRGFNLQKVRVSDPDMLQNLLIVVCLAFLIVFTLGLNKAKVKVSRIIRKDRVDAYSVFQIGFRIANYIIENQIDIFYKIKDIFKPYFCVRF